MYKHKYLKYKLKCSMLEKMNQYGGKKINTNDNMSLIPKNSKSENVLKFNFPEIEIASVQYDEGPVGCTYIRFCVDNAMFYCDSRGGWPATIATDQSRADKNLIKGICFAGGSLLGL